MSVEPGGTMGGGSAVRAGDDVDRDRFAYPVVVVGSGLTGMAISHTLSRAAIPHVVIGGAPGPLPRLGESLNLEGTLRLDEFCGAFSRYFSSKKQGIVYLGDYVLSCGFNVARKARSRGFFRLLGETAPSEFLHLDRLGLDAAMYERMVTSPDCQVADAKVERIDHDPASDQVIRIELSDGTVLHPRYVFDGSNHHRTVAKAAGVPCTLLGSPQRVVYTHYHPPGRRPPEEARRPCDESTNLLRLSESIDGLDAMAWYIPLPTYVSIGVSMDEGTNELSDDAVLDAAHAAYERRGLHYRTRFPEAAPTMTLHHRYFVHERAYGANWMLAGGTFASVWWLAGAGVGTSFVAGRLAPTLVADPIGVGRAYQDYLMDLVPIHTTFDWFVYTDLNDVGLAAVQRQSNQFIRTNVSRLAHAAQLRGRLVSTAAGRLLARLLRGESFMSGYCRIDAAPLAEQTERSFGLQPGSESAAHALDAVRALGEVIAGRVPLAASDELLDEQVVSHLGPVRVRGRSAWRTWLLFLRSHRGARAAELIDVQTVLRSDGRVQLTGRWRTPRGVSHDATATYRVVGGRIVEIWTDRANYTFLLGRVATSRLGMPVVLAWVAVSSRFRRSGDPDRRAA